MRVLGLDVSSTTIGIAVLDVDPITKKVTLTHLDHFNPPKEGHILDRLSQTRAHLTQVFQTWQPSEIAIEDILLGAGKTTTIKTLSILSIFNRVIGLAALDHLKKVPHLFNVMKIRHGLKSCKELPKKEEIPELVAKHLNIPFPYLYKKPRVAKKSKKPPPAPKLDIVNYDRADAIAVALYYLKQL